MGRFIVRLDGAKGSAYFEWSTVSDAPASCGMTLAAFREYYRLMYGAYGMITLDERLFRVEQKGTSASGDIDARDTIRGNRAGAHESEMTAEQLYEAQTKDW